MPLQWHFQASLSQTLMTRYAGGFQGVSPHPTTHCAVNLSPGCAEFSLLWVTGESPMNLSFPDLPFVPGSLVQSITFPRKSSEGDTRSGSLQKEEPYLPADPQGSSPTEK